VKRVLAASSLLFAALVWRVAAEEPPVVEEVVDAPPAEVWRLFTTKEGLSSWLSPVAEIDLRIGGAIRTNYNPQGKIGGLGTLTRTILSYDPARMLSLKTSGVPADFPSKKLMESVWTVIYFEPAGEARTRVRVVGLGYGDDAESKVLRDLFEKGNAGTLEKLKRRVSAGTIAAPR
jgi:uncharacterized protein YndB with AHSA1/START domain